MKKIVNAYKKYRYLLCIPFLFILLRVPTLGYDMFNTDVFKWKARIFDFGSGVFYLDFAKTIQKYHPGVSLMWPGALAVKFFNLKYDLFNGFPPPDNDINVVFELHAVQKYAVVFVIAVTLAFIFYALEKTIGRKYAILATFLIAVEPFYVALTRVIHLEGMMTTYMLASFSWYYYFLQDKTQRKRLLLSGVFGALAVLTKTTALFMLPFVFLVSFLSNYLKTHQSIDSLKFSFKHGLPWLATAFFGFVLLWPGVWVAPIEVFNALTRGVDTIGIEGGHSQLFLGNWIESDPGVIFYPVVLWLRSSLYLLIGLVGFLFIAKNLNKKEKEFALFVFLFAVFYTIELSIPSKKLDRYLLPSIVSLLLLSTFFYKYLWEKLKDAKNLRLLLFIPALIHLVYLHPNYFAYYNPLAGGLSKGIFMLEPKWTFGQQELMQYLNELVVSENLELFSKGESFHNSDSLDNKLTVAFPEKYYTQLEPFIKLIGGWAVIESLTAEAMETNFFIYPVWDDYSANETRFDLEKIGTVKVHGVDIYNVYRRY